VARRLGKICTWLPRWLGIDMWPRRCSSMMMRMLPCMGKISEKINVDSMGPCKNLLSRLSVERTRSILNGWGSSRDAVCYGRGVARWRQILRPLSWLK
jgi:hypothetical protein